MVRAVTRLGASDVARVVLVVVGVVQLVRKPSVWLALFVGAVWLGDSLLRPRDQGPRRAGTARRERGGGSRRSVVPQRSHHQCGRVLRRGRAPARDRVSPHHGARRCSASRWASRSRLPRPACCSRCTGSPTSSPASRSVRAGARSCAAALGRTLFAPAGRVATAARVDRPRHRARWSGELRGSYRHRAPDRRRPRRPRVPRGHRVARLRGDGPHPTGGGGRHARRRHRPPPRHRPGVPRRGVVPRLRARIARAPRATTACPTGPRAPAPTWARSCCSTARCSTTPPSRAASAPSTGRSPRPTTTTVDLAPDGEHDRWRAHLVGVATRLDPFTYRDAAIVAQRLHTITSRRPRLAFDADLVGAVRARMVSVQPRIMSSATDVLDRVVGAVAGTRPRRRSTLRK